MAGTEWMTDCLPDVHLVRRAKFATVQRLFSCGAQNESLMLAGVRQIHVVFMGKYFCSVSTNKAPKHGGKRSSAWVASIPDGGI